MNTLDPYTGFHKTYRLNLLPDRDVGIPLWWTSTSKPIECMVPVRSAYTIPVILHRHPHEYHSNHRVHTKQASFWSQSTLKCALLFVSDHLGFLACHYTQYSAMHQCKAAGLAVSWFLLAVAEHKFLPVTVHDQCVHLESVSRWVSYGYEWYITHLGSIITVIRACHQGCVLM